MLHVTNGDSAAGSIGQTGLPGEVLPWRDVLFEGPVPDALSPEALRAVRARFISDSGWGGYDETLAGFTARDEALANYSAHEEVTLWFEHDLYDQLQLLQVLDFFAGRDLGTTRLSLICVDSYPQVEPFYGLGQLTPQQLATLFPTRQQVTSEQMQIAQKAWQAFRSANPQALEALLAEDTSALPFLHDALRRHLEEFPSTEDGLSRTEREVLELVSADVRQPGALFHAWMERESAPFMGDTSFFARIRDLSRGPSRLLQVSGSGDGVLALPSDGNTMEAFQAQELEVTPAGQAVLAGAATWGGLADVDGWLGGAHLSAQDAEWRWGRNDERLVLLAD